VADRRQSDHCGGRDRAQPDGHVARQPPVAAPTPRHHDGRLVRLGLGGWLSGYIGRFWETLPHSQFFFMVVGILVATAVPLSLMTPQIKRTIARS
jgi:hypothetical protein